MHSTAYAQYDFATVVDEEGEQRFLRTASLPLLSTKEEQDLARRIAAGDQEAFERLVRSNLPWASLCGDCIRTTRATMMTTMTKGQRTGLMVMMSTAGYVAGCVARYRTNSY
jgi:hypothetical protein